MIWAGVSCAFGHGRLFRGLFEGFFGERRWVFGPAGPSGGVRWPLWRLFRLGEADGVVGRGQRVPVVEGQVDEIEGNERILAQGFLAGDGYAVPPKFFHELV